MGNITIKMLAKKLNLSTATISKALRDSHEISIGTKTLVKALATQWNYSPNPYAGSLRRRSSKTIAVVLPEVTDSFFSHAINGIQSVADEKGYHVLIYLTHESYEREKLILKEFQNGRVDGILISISSETSDYQHLEDLVKKLVPIVFFDRVCEKISAAKVITDDFESGYKATVHLIENGCKRIAVLSFSNSLSIITNRVEGYKAALNDHQIKLHTSDILLCGNNQKENMRLIAQLMRRKPRPEGILVTTEKLTPDIYLACQTMNLKIPSEVKVVCFSNLSTASILLPALTTITQPAFEIGKTAALLLCKALGKKSFDLSKESVIIPSKLIIRESSLAKGIVIALKTP